MALSWLTGSSISRTKEEAMVVEVVVVVVVIVDVGCAVVGAPPAWVVVTGAIVDAGESVVEIFAGTNSTGAFGKSAATPGPDIHTS